ncbi:MAG: hypothetical protein ACKUBY_01480 [Candidatus Moraniibacteriota bacterium]|jgi:hypothetical protein
MKLFKKVSVIETKRCFVLSQRFTSKKMRKKGIKEYNPDKDTLIQNLSKTKKKVLKLREKSLDKIIGDEYKKRLKAYETLDWYLGEVNVSEVKVWNRTGGLYESWTQRVSLSQTAQKLRVELKKDKSKIQKRRAFQVVPQIIPIKRILQKEKYLLPIVVPNGTYKKHNGGIKTISWFLDDGCMRSLAYAVSGDEKIKVYIGILKSE